MSDDSDPLTGPAGPVGPAGEPGHTGPPGHAGPQGVPGLATTPAALARAVELKQALSDNTEALNQVKRHQFITTGALLGLLIAYVVLGALFFQVRATQQSACESGNKVREGLLHVADVLEASQQEPRADGRERTPREIEQGREFVADLRRNFALRDCGS